MGKRRYPILSADPTEAEVEEFMDVAQKRFHVDMRDWEPDREGDPAHTLLSFMSEIFRRAEAKQSGRI